MGQHLHWRCLTATDNRYWVEPKRGGKMFLAHFCTQILGLFYAERDAKIECERHALEHNNL